MGRSSLIPLGAAALVVAIFAASSCAQEPNNVVIIPQPDGGIVCDFATRGCPAGEACLNSICSSRCIGGAQCPPGTYCEGDASIDQVCAALAPIACSSSPQCPAPQVCSSGLCTSSELLGDGGRGACAAGQLDDGCSADGVCVTASNGSASCVGLPGCAQDGRCPVGPAGATCNVRPDGGRLFPGKQRVCLVSFCDGPTDCPAASPHCVNGLGPARSLCSPGTTGVPCTKGADCNSGTCNGANPPTAFGTCT